MFLFCLVFAMSLCASVYMCFVVTCWERADLLALICGVYCEFVTFPLGQVLYLIVSIPDLYTLTYFTYIAKDKAVGRVCLGVCLGMLPGGYSLFLLHT